MLEDDTISCPVCDNDINVKVRRAGPLAKDVTYFVVVDCPSCKTSANKIEKMLNGRSKLKSEKSYIKVDPRGRGKI